MRNWTGRERNSDNINCAVNGIPNELLCPCLQSPDPTWDFLAQSLQYIVADSVEIGRAAWRESGRNVERYGRKQGGRSMRNWTGRERNSDNINCAVNGIPNELLCPCLQSPDPTWDFLAQSLQYIVADSVEIGRAAWREPVAMQWIRDDAHQRVVDGVLAHGVAVHDHYYKHAEFSQLRDLALHVGAAYVQRFRGDYQEHVRNVISGSSCRRQLVCPYVLQGPGEGCGTASICDSGIYRVQQVLLVGVAR